MNVITILIWITIAIIAAIAIIVVKLHYANDELETEEKSMLSDGTDAMQNALSGIKEKIASSSDELSKDAKTHSSNLFNKPKNDGPASLRKEGTKPEEYTAVIVPEVGNNNASTIEYESPTQVTINYEKEVKKFQEPIKQSQMDIMNQNKLNDKEENKHELKDLFTIDELIKESKRKDSEREKESKRISRDEDSDLDDIKESIKMRKENKLEDALIEEVVDEKETKDSIADAIKSSEIEEPKLDTSASQKDIDEAIESATKESEEEIEDISETESITDVLLETEEKEEEIKAPTLKSPTKINEGKEGVSILSGEDKDYKFGGELEDSELFNDDMNDLDYRKDIAKVTNKLRNSRLLQDVKDRLTQEPEPDNGLDESFIRNVHEYDEYAPIINETYVDTDEDYDAIHAFDDVDPKLRQANTLKVFKNKAVSEATESKVAPIKDKPSRDNIKINLNNNEVVLKKGDEIIFKHDGETYSSQVYAINGDDISVRYRRKNITIKADDVKKIY